MFNSIVLNIKKERFNKYSEAFNFFQSKSINMISGARKLDYVVHFRDLEFLDDETEYFKRYYASSQTATRLRKLINYYEINMTPPTPNLLPIHNYHILETRNRKLLKLCIMKQKSLAKKGKEEEDESSGNMILSQLNQSNLSAATSEKEEDSENQSYDSDPFNAYQEGEQQIRQTGNGVKNKALDLINLKDIGESFLVFDFKAIVEQPPVLSNIPAINVIPPAPKQPILKPPPISTNSVGIQTIPIQSPPPPKKLQKRQQKPIVVAPVIIPQLIKEPIIAITPVSQAARSQIKNQNMMLTESIDLVRKVEQKKPNTFMEYYNSIPVKSPSNILQRYIKRKK